MNINKVQDLIIFTIDFVKDELEFEIIKGVVKILKSIVNRLNNSFILPD